MAVNATTGVDPEVDKFAIWDNATNQYLNLQASWPRPDGGPIVGGNPDRKYYKRVNVEKPDADHRYTIATVWNKSDTSPAPPEGHPSGTYSPTHTATKLSAEDLKIQVETEFQRQLQLLFPASQNPAVLLEGAGAIIRKTNNAQLTTEQQSKLDTVVTVDDAIATLRVRQAELNAAIDADEDYDITDGWS